MEGPSYDAESWGRISRSTIMSHAASAPSATNLKTTVESTAPLKPTAVLEPRSILNSSAFSQPQIVIRRTPDRRKIVWTAIGCLIAFLVMFFAARTSSASDTPNAPEAVTVDGITFDNTQEFWKSPYFKASGKRCHTQDRETRLAANLGLPKFNENPDCSSTATNPRAIYDPGAQYQMQVVVHILMDNSCSQGKLTDAQVRSQIAILNEDFQAISGSNGSAGYASGIRFALATRDPQGRPTSGITRTCNSTYFNDGGSYWQQLAWDPSRYINIYTNNGGGGLGYVPYLPADGNPGSKGDRVVVAWDTFGKNASGGAPYNLGRTATHEIGHYLGLEHTFTGSCANASAPACYRNGDLICDTNAEAEPVYSPCSLGSSSSCGSTDPSDNYMDYSDDQCMRRFTRQQVRRMRCSIESYRAGLIQNSTPPPSTGTCTADNDTLCLNDGRFQVDVTWNGGGQSGKGQVASAGTPDTGLIYFFDANNWEMLVKVLDGCALNNRFWVYSAATTDLGYTLTVTDTDTGAVKTYTNAPGSPAPAVTDAEAFATCN